jgi:DNA polymerase III subunit gamma/tau
MSDETSNTPYRVLARKYRPSTFDELIGHDAMVKTLSNALDSGRLAHAFVLTGTRGIGKTTTARIIARGLNCIGTDGEGGPTIAPCGICTNCVAIAEDRHQDVLEMDAASRTGVDDIRELIDGVRYLPVIARFKIYIIDEVHMLSKNAFNALLKTLEEPPEHVKFIFATTEIRKIPVTVLSRCQRFDLKRVDGDTLASYFATIAEKENVNIEADALALIARSAEGSVRDGLSLLDQAIAHGDGAVTALQVRDMLGLADKTRVLDLLTFLMQGEIQQALGLLRSQYDSGADPIVIIQDLLELTHWLTALKVTPEAANNVAISGGDVSRGQELSAALSMPVLARAWQMLLKGLDEVRRAPMPISAAEMVLVRLAYVSDLPSPEDLAKKISQQENVTSTPRPSGSSGSKANTVPVMVSSSSVAVSKQLAPSVTPEENPRAHLSLVAETQHIVEPLQVATIPVPKDIDASRKALKSLEDVVNLLSDRQDIKLKAEVANFMRLVKFEEGYLEFSPTAGASSDLAAKLGVRLREITGDKWIVNMAASSDGAPTLAEKRQHDKAAEIDALQSHPMVRSIQNTFPGATIREVRNLGPALESTTEHDTSDEQEID